ncbi:MAG: sulfatase-like hydrolase/transferase [Paludibacteraceae bacterium]
MKHTGKILPAAVGLSSMVFHMQAKENKDLRPNIIFILADDMGYGDLACYGNKIIKTPNIDKLASEGIRFTQAYAGSGVSAPSRCSLLTGKHTGHTTIRDNFAKRGGLTGLKNGNTIRRASILPEDTTIATILNAAGYRTCLVNKWHLDGFNPNAGPLDRGFDEFYGWLVSKNESNLPYYYPALRYCNRELKEIPENKNKARGIHDSDLSVNESIDFIKRNKKNPFFLYLAFDVPHEPYVINDLERYKSMNLSETAKLYAALITHTDEAIGKLIRYLDENNLRENTLIIFTSDNGAATMAPIGELDCNAGLKGHKAQLYEGGIKEPFIVNFPKKIKGHQLKNNLIYFPDIMPTLAEYAHAKLPRNTDGISLKPLLEGKYLNTEDRILYWEFPGRQVAVRKGKWKAVSVKKGTKLELYNISVDPFEKNNLANEHPEIISELEKEIKKQHTSSPYWPIDGE